jgi:hypothetical protein
LPGLWIAAYRPILETMGEAKLLATIGLSRMPFYRALAGQECRSGTIAVLRLYLTQAGQTAALPPPPDARGRPPTGDTGMPKSTPAGPRLAKTKSGTKASKPAPKAGKSYELVALDRETVSKAVAKREAATAKRAATVAAKDAARRKRVREGSPMLETVLKALVFVAADELQGVDVGQPPYNQRAQAIRGLQFRIQQANREGRTQEEVLLEACDFDSFLADAMKMSLVHALHNIDARLAFAARGL